MARCLYNSDFATFLYTDSDSISQEYIDCPFYGMVETCFGEKPYHSYLNELRSLSDMIIDYLESRFDFSKIKLEEL